MAYGEEAGTAAGNDDISDNVSDFDGGSTSTSDSSSTSSSSGGVSDDDDDFNFDPGRTDTADDAEDAFGAGGGSEFDDDFGLDDTGGSGEDAQDAAASGGAATDDATPDASAPRDDSDDSDSTSRTDTAELAEDAAGAGLLGPEQSTSDGAAEAASDLAATGSLESQQPEPGGTAPEPQSQPDRDATRDPTLERSAERQGRATFAEGFDVLAGSTDEAVGRATSAASEGDVAGVGDALAGSTDEAFARGNRADDPVRSVDEALGPTDELAGQAARSVPALATGAGDAVATGVRQTGRAQVETADELAQGDVVGAVETNVATRLEQTRGTGFDPDVADDLTSGGVLTEEEEQTLRGASSRFDEAAADVSDEVQVVGGGDENAINRVSQGSAESLLGVGNVFGVAQSAETATEIATNTPGEIDEGNAGAIGGSAVAVGTAAGAAAVRQAQSEPAETVGGVGGSVGASAIGGVAAGRGITSAASRARAARIRAGGGDIFDADELADPPTRTEGMELPGFTDEAQADPEVARREFIEQAEDNPLGGDSPTAVSVRGREAVQEFGGFGRSSEAPEGTSEVPGQFFAADISNLRLPGADSGGGPSLPRPGLPSGRIRSARVLAEEDVDVDTAPEGDTGDLGEFLAEEAPRDRSFIRADSGDGPTPEQEVIAPPGSQFETTDGLFGVRVGGREVFGRRVGGEVLFGRITRRADAADADLDSADTIDRGDIAEQNTASLRRAFERQRGDREPVGPTGLPRFDSASDIRSLRSTDRRLLPQGFDRGGSGSSAPSGASSILPTSSVVAGRGSGSGGSSGAGSGGGGSGAEGSGSGGSSGGGGSGGGSSGGSSGSGGSGGSGSSSTSSLFFFTGSSSTPGEPDTDLLFPEADQPGASEPDSIFGEDRLTRDVDSVNEVLF